MRYAVPSAAIALGFVAHASAQPIDTTPRMAVMSAFAPEWTMLKEATENAESHAVAGTTYVTGDLEGVPVVLFLSGVSMVNAAMTTQAAIDHFAVTGIVFSGIAGGVDPTLNIGDVVVADDWGQYLESVFARETVDGYALPPFADTPFPNYGMMFPQAVDVLRAGVEAEERFWFPVDPEFLAIARKIAGGVALEDCATDCLGEKPKLVIGGNGVSGAAFVDNADFRSYVFDTFAARVLDMESAAVAHVAYANDVPFIAFRSLSDLAGGGEAENEIGTFFQLAANNSATVVRAFLSTLAVPQ